MPEPELILWAKLRNKQLKGLKFRRQHGVGSYVLDFYCPFKRLAIELDGHSHYLTKWAQIHDLNKDQFLLNHNMKILRFTNKEIEENLDGVLAKILQSIL